MLSIWTCKNYCYISLTGKIRRQTSFPSQPRNLLPKGQAMFEVQHLKVRLMYMHRVDKSPWYSDAINKTKTSLPWLKWRQGSSGETARVAFSIKQLFFYLCSIFPSDRKWHTFYPYFLSIISVFSNFHICETNCFKHVKDSWVEC